MKKLFLSILSSAMIIGMTVSSHAMYPEKLPIYKPHDFESDLKKSLDSVEKKAREYAAEYRLNNIMNKSIYSDPKVLRPNAPEFKLLAFEQTPIQKAYERLLRKYAQEDDARHQNYIDELDAGFEERQNNARLDFDNMLTELDNKVTSQIEALKFLNLREENAPVLTLEQQRLNREQDRARQQTALQALHDEAKRMEDELNGL